MASLIAQIHRRHAWPFVILAGIVLVTLAVFSGGHAALTGVALIAVGGLGELTSREPSPARGAWLMLHGSVYLMLYLVFLGARIDLGGDWVLLAVDLLMSIIVLTAFSPVAIGSPPRKWWG